jgi:hypothetical protein
MPTKKSAPRMMSYHLPEDVTLLAAFGAVAIRHSQLEHALTMMVKTVAELSVEEADAATAELGVAEVREIIKRVAKQAWGECPALLKTRGLMTRAKRLSSRRNDLLHGLLAQELDGRPMKRSREKGWEPIPSADELNALANEIYELIHEMNHERLEGFIATAMKAKKKRPVAAN